MNKKNLKYVICASIGILGAVILNAFFELIFVNGHSMEPTLKDRQILIVNKNTSNVKVGDIVVAKIIRFDNAQEETIIKRVIATEGQTIEIKSGKVFVDDKEIVETYIKEPMDSQSFAKIAVPEGEVYLMGDNRNNSLDSRIQGTVKISQIKSKLIKIK